MNSLKSSLKVRLILFNQGKILLLKQTKLNGGNYTLVGGNVELGETSKEALVRECKEELASAPPPSAPSRGAARDGEPRPPTP